MSICLHPVFDAGCPLVTIAQAVDDAVRVTNPQTYQNR